MMAVVIYYLQPNHLQNSVGVNAGWFSSGYAVYTPSPGNYLPPRITLQDHEVKPRSIPRPAGQSGPGTTDNRQVITSRRVFAAANTSQLSPFYNLNTISAARCRCVK